MDYLDYTFKDTGKSFVDVLNLLKNEQEQDIQNYMEILRSQMKKGVVARSVYYNEKQMNILIVLDFPIIINGIEI